MVETTDKLRFASRWRLHASLLAAALVALGLGYGDTLANLVNVWSTSSTFNHCFLIPFIAIFLAYHKRPELERCAPSVSAWGLAYIAVNALLWVLGEVMSLAVFMHAAVVGMIIGSGWALLGQTVFRQLLFPFLYLYFAVPEGEFLVPYLQDWTALVMVFMLKLIGMPVFVEGRYVSIPSGSFTVAEACSGINYLIATMSVATMFAYLQFRSYRRRAIFMVAAVIVPLVANGLRAFGIVMISHLSGYTLAKGVDHFIYGWVFFGFVITILFWVGRTFSDIDEAVPSPGADIAVDSPGKGNPWWMLVAALVLAFLPRLALMVLDSARPLAPTVELHAATGWRGPDAESPALGLNYAGAEQHLAARYVAADDTAVSVEVAYFRSQGDKGELINQNNRVFDIARWRQISHALRDVPVPALGSRVNQLHLRANSGKEYLLWYWYDAQALRSSGGLPIKLAEGWARMRGLNAGSAVVTIRTEVTGDLARAEAGLASFLETGAPLLENMRPQP